MTTNTTKTERVRVQISVEEGPLGYPINPAEYYVAVVGSGPQLGNENPYIAPRCKRVGNNIWVKEIWVPKESWITFKFLIVHAPSNRIVQIEEIPCHRIFISHFPVVVETRFNQVKIKGGRGFYENGPTMKQESNGRDTSQELRIEAEKCRDSGETPAIQKEEKLIERVYGIDDQLKEKEKEQQRIGAGDINIPELTKLKDSKPDEKRHNSEHGDGISNEVVRRNKNKICREDMQKVFNEIRKDFKFEKVLTKNGDMVKIQLKINQSVFARFRLRPKNIDKAAEGFGLQPIQNLLEKQDGFFRQQLWLPKDMFEEFLKRKRAETYRLAISDKEADPVHENKAVVTPAFINGALLHRTNICRSNHTTGIYERNKSRRPIILGNIERIIPRTLQPILDKQSTVTQDMRTKLKDSAIDKQSVELNFKEISESDIKREANTFNDQATEPQVAETVRADLNKEYEVELIDNKEIQKEQSSGSLELPYNLKGLALIATGLAVVAGLKYFVFK